MKRFYLIIASILCFSFTNTYAQVNESDSLALVDIYNAAGGSNWANQGNWLTGTVDTWEGVVVSGGRVTELSMYQGDMSGTISPSIGNLTELTKLEIKGDEEALTYVDIHGSIPAELWSCTKIERLQIKFTKITGDIPAGIESMVNLQEINFQATPLNCELPAELFELPSLTKAYLHQSGFTGTVPSTLTGATNLVRLYLQGNHLSAGLPFVQLGSGAKIELTGNYFSFADVKPYHDNVSSISRLTDEYQLAKDTTVVTVASGDDYTLDGTVENGNEYYWFKGEDMLSQTAGLTLTGIQSGDAGIYTCKAMNTDMIDGFEIRTVVNLGVEEIPVVTSTETTIGGDSILITFDYEIADASANAGSFTVLSNSVAVTVVSVANDAANAKTIILILGSAIPDNTYTVTVTYTPGTLAGSTGGAVAAFGPVTVTNNVLTSASSFDVVTRTYPNPAYDILNIQSSSKINEIGLFDLTGRKVKAISNISDNSVAVQVSDMQKGVYLLTVKTSDGLSTQRIAVK